jgi:hypothetical protein
MNPEDRRLIWALIMTLTGVYILILPTVPAMAAMAFSAYVAHRAMNRP